MQLNRRSWHAWFINTFTPYAATNYDDICSYTRILLRAIFTAVFTITLGVALVTFLGSGLVAIVLAFIYGAKSLPNIMGVAMVIDVMIVFLIGVLFLKNIIEDKIQERRDARRINPPEPGFLKLAYRSWHEKYCAKVEWTK